jgi:hypothetical protein
MAWQPVFLAHSEALAANFLVFLARLPISRLPCASMRASLHVPLATRPIIVDARKKRTNLCVRAKTILPRRNRINTALSQLMKKIFHNLP